MIDLNEIEVLTLRCLDGEATPEEQAKLAHLVATDDTAAERYCELLDLEATLRGAEPPSLVEQTLSRVGTVQADRVSAGVMDRLKGLKPGEGDPEEEGPTLSSGVTPSAPSGRRWQAVAPGLLIAATAGGIGFYLGQRRGAPKDPAQSSDSDAENGRDLDRQKRTEDEIRRLQAELKRMRAAQERLTQQAQRANADRPSLAKLQRTLEALKATQQPLITDLKRAPKSKRGRLRAARTELDKLAALRKQLDDLRRQGGTLDLNAVQRLIAEIGEQTALLRSVIQLARAVRPRPAFRRRALRRPAARAKEHAIDAFH